jgi:phage terminase small subunit
MGRQPLRKITAQQGKFLDYYLLSGNATKAADHAGYGSPKQRGHEQTKKLKKEIEEGQKSMLKNSVPTAINNIILLAEQAESEAVRLNACKDLLDRAGYKPTEKMETEVTHVQEKSITELQTELEALTRTLQ